MTRKAQLDLRVDDVRIKWEQDTEGHATWSVVAIATVSYQLGSNGDRRLETLSSAGLHGIELGDRASADAMYRSELEDEQLEDLRLHLRVFGINVDAGLVNWSEHRRRTLRSSRP